MLALLLASKYLNKKVYMDCALKASNYYRKWFNQGNLDEATYLVFFANWQSQAHRLLIEYNLNNPDVVLPSKEFVFKVELFFTMVRV